jgi:cytidine deaminase
MADDAAVPGIDDLTEMALAARERAYAPYSKYLVGCVLLANGHLYEGANVENASHGLTICAERTTICEAVLAGERALDVVVVATQSSPPASPCGMCLQTMTEFCDDPDKLRIILVNPGGERREFTLAQLLPYGFQKDQLV